MNLEGKGGRWSECVYSFGKAVSLASESLTVPPESLRWLFKKLFKAHWFGRKWCLALGTEAFVTRFISLSNHRYKDEYGVVLNIILNKCIISGG